MKVISRVALAACLLASGASQAVGTTDADQEKLQGKWKVESFEFNGKPVEALKNAIREFKDGKYTLTPASGEVFNGTVKVDSTKKPKEIDLVINERTLKGIYELDGDTLKISYVLEGDERPKELASKPDSRTVLVVHKREK
jgi:uncharacterized protein (TIGR03067 family)